MGIRAEQASVGVHSDHAVKTRAQPGAAHAAAEAATSPPSPAARVQIPTAATPAARYREAVSPQGMAAAAAEIELKFSIAPEQAARLGSLPIIKPALRGRAVTRTVHSVYYDTPDFALRRDRIALRLRRDGNRWTQTIKTAGAVEAGLHQRQEFDTPLPAHVLNYPALAATGASTVFTDPELRAQLRPVFATDFKRTTRDLLLPCGARVELAYDSGGLTAGEAGSSISEIELELKAGGALPLIEFAQALAALVPMRLEPLSKAQRGYALAAGASARPVKAAAPNLSAEISVADAFREVVLGCIAHLQANERGVLDGEDYEYLHQARVAIRRLRSALSVFSAAFPRAVFLPHITELRWLGSRLGSARDWDVLAMETLPALTTALPGDPGLHALMERVAERREDADRAARDAIDSQRYTALLLQFIGVFHRHPWLTMDDPQPAAQRDRPLVEFASDVLARRHKKVCKRGRGHADLDAAGLHALRIEVKKLRYAADFFSSLWNRKPVRVYTSALAALQEVLGSLNDAATAERLCEELRDPGQEPGWAESLGILRGWAAATARWQLERFPDAWDAFRDTEPFWE